MTELPASALVPAVMKKAGLVWIELDGKPPVAAWHVWHEGACYVLHGSGEQRVPGLGDSTECRVIVRAAATRQRTAAWDAAVSRVAPDGEEWAEIAPLLLAKRLNLRDHDDAVARWEAECTLSRLDPHS